MTLLELPQDVAPYQDIENRREYLSARVYDVPEDSVERYRNDGWIDPESSKDSVAQFISVHWATLVGAIEDGEHDDHLDILLSAEKDRLPSPRHSVVEAIEQRKETIAD